MTGECQEVMGRARPSSLLCVSVSSLFPASSSLTHLTVSDAQYMPSMLFVSECSVQTFNLSTYEGKAEGLPLVQGQPRLHNEFQSSLG